MLTFICFISLMWLGIQHAQLRKKHRRLQNRYAKLRKLYSALQLQLNSLHKKHHVTLQLLKQYDKTNTHYNSAL